MHTFVDNPNLEMRLVEEVLERVKRVLRTFPCEKYDDVDRLGILSYHDHPKKQELSDLVQLAIRSHILARQSGLTRLETPIDVFCPDTLENIWCLDSIDLVHSLRLKLGKRIETYEDLVTWYLSL